MPPELLYGRVLPGAAVSLVVGNLFYAWQARRLAARTGRTDVCALPYGINTVSLFGHVFLIMLPAKLAAEAAGAADPVARRVAGRTGRHARLRADRARAGARRRRASAAPRRAPRCSRPWPASRSASSRSASSSAPSSGPSSGSRRSPSCWSPTSDASACAAACRAAWSRWRSGTLLAWLHRRRAGRHPPLSPRAPPAGAGAGRPRGRARRPPPARVLLGHPADGPVQRRRLAAEHRERRGGGRPLSRPRRRSR